MTKQLETEQKAKLSENRKKSIKNLILKHSHCSEIMLYVGYMFSTNIESLPVMYMCDCRFPVSKDPGLNIYGFSFGISYSCIYYPLETF